MRSLRLYHSQSKVCPDYDSAVCRLATEDVVIEGVVASHFAPRFKPQDMLRHFVELKLSCSNVMTRVHCIPSQFHSVISS